LGGLCRLFGYAFGLPPNVNVYCTPPSCSLSVPLHTDKQDVFVFQSQGTKRWRIYAPPPRSPTGGTHKDPLARGKNGDVLSFDELESPLIDTVLRPGDVLYVPTGFPHTTDTTTPVVEEGDGADTAVASVHLTMGLDTHVWFLALAHLRWSLLQRCGKTYSADLTDDALYWKAMRSIPFGFLGGPAWRLTVKSIQDGHGVGADFKAMVADQLMEVLIRMEPTRWKEASDHGTESLPTREQIDETIEFFVAKHWKVLMETQEGLFKDVDPRKEESLMKAFRGTQEQNQIMEDFGWFSNNKAFAESFRSRRLMNEQRAQMAAQL
jgi:Cupin superfamily protein